MSNDSSRPVHSFAITWVDAAFRIQVRFAGPRNAVEQFLHRLTGEGKLLCSYTYQGMKVAKGRDVNSYDCYALRRNQPIEAVIAELCDAAVESGFAVIDRTAPPPEQEIQTPSETA